MRNYVRHFITVSPKLKSLKEGDIKVIEVLDVNIIDEVEKVLSVSVDELDYANMDKSGQISALSDTKKWSVGICKEEYLKGGSYVGLDFLRCKLIGSDKDAYNTYSLRFTYEGSIDRDSYTRIVQ